MRSYTDLVFPEDQTSSAHAETDAHGHNSDLLVPPLQFLECCDDQPRTRGAEGVTKGTFHY